MASVTQGDCAGHSAAPHASNQELSNKGGSAPPLPQLSKLGAWKPLRDQQGRLLLWAELHHGHLSLALELRLTNCPLINPCLCNRDLCLHW